MYAGEVVYTIQLNEMKREREREREREKERDCLNSTENIHKVYKHSKKPMKKPQLSVLKLRELSAEKTCWMQVISQDLDVIVFP